MLHEVKRRRRSYAVLFAVGAIAQSVSPACSSERDRTVSVASAPGRLELQLTAVTASGDAYRLRQGTLTITGLATGFQTQVSTEDDPTRTSLLVELPLDTFEVYLEPGFYLERMSSAASALAARRAERARNMGKPFPLPISDGATDAAAGEAPAPALPPVLDPVEPPTPSGEIVEASLESPNPSYVTISPDFVTRLDFVFRVAGELVQTGSGVLDVGIEVLEGGLCVNDAYEPNDYALQATPISAGVDVEARACPFDYDFYVFDAPVPAGQVFSVTVSFVHALGDIDAELWNATTGEFVAYGGSVSDQELLIALSDGGAYQLVVFSYFAEVGNDYRVEIRGLEPSTNDCCEASSSPGCNQNEIQNCTCAQDSTCCSAAWDDVCVAQAVTGCALECPGAAATSDCCSATAEPGCLEPELEQCVCAIDPYCCISSFDDNCVALANTQCGASCN